MHDFRRHQRARKARAPGGILLAFFRYGLNGTYELTASATAQTASGIAGCVIFAGGEAREAIEGGTAGQIGPVEKEAGVRKQL